MGVELIEGCSEDGTTSQLLLADLVYSLKLMLPRNLSYRFFFKVFFSGKRGFSFSTFFRNSFQLLLITFLIGFIVRAGKATDGGSDFSYISFHSSEVSLVASIPLSKIIPWDAFPSEIFSWTLMGSQKAREILDCGKTDCTGKDRKSQHPYHCSS